MSTTIQPEYNRFITGNFTVAEHVTTGNFVIYICELGLCLVAFPLNLMFFYLLLTTCSIHKNLRMLLMSTCVADMCHSVSRYLILTPMLVAYMYNVEISTIFYCWIAKSFHHIVDNLMSVTLFLIIIERTIATYWYRNYENNTFHHIGIILIIFQWLYGFLFTVANQIDLIGTPRIYPRLPCQMEYTTGRMLTVHLIFIISLNIVAVFTFFKIKAQNKKLFTERAWKLSKLTETYQISENMRSMRLLTPIVGVMLFSNVLGIFSTGLNALVYITVRDTPIEQRADIIVKIVGRGSEINQTNDICTTLVKIGFCYTIKLHPVLRRNFLNSFNVFKNKSVRVKKEEGVNSVTSIEGRKLHFSRIEETVQHFDSLKEMWR